MAPDLEMKMAWEKNPPFASLQNLSLAGPSFFRAGRPQALCPLIPPGHPHPVLAGPEDMRKHGWLTPPGRPCTPRPD